VLLYTLIILKIRDLFSVKTLKASVNEILTRHSLKHDVTYDSNTSFLGTKISKILGMQLAVDGLKGTK